MDQAGESAAPSPAHPAGDASAIAALVADAAEGSQDAWRSIVHAFGPRVFALVRSRCGDAEFAEEVTQAVFATAAEKLTIGGPTAYTEQGRFEAWLFRIAMNRVRDEARRRKRRNTVHGGLRLHDAEGSERTTTISRGGAANRAEDCQLNQMRRAMAQLGDADREVIALRHHGEMTFKQMSELLGEPVGTLLARHHRALRKLKDKMEQATDHEPRETERSAGASDPERAQAQRKAVS